jgi:copper chaperone CopZ
MPPGTTQTVLLIVGMRDYRCREAVAAALQSVRGVSEVHVSLFRSCATLLHEPDCGLSDCLAAVVQAGYGASLASGSAAPQRSKTGRQMHDGSDDGNAKETPS